MLDPGGAAVCTKLHRYKKDHLDPRKASPPAVVAAPPCPALQHGELPLRPCRSLAGQWLRAALAGAHARPAAGSVRLIAKIDAAQDNAGRLALECPIQEFAR